MVVVCNLVFRQHIVSLHPRRTTTKQLRLSSTKSEVNECNRLLIFGLGNIGMLVAEKAKTFSINEDNMPYFDHVLGTTRGAKELNDIQVVHVASDELKCILPTCTHVLVTSPPIDMKSNSDSMGVMVGGRPRSWEFFCDPILNHPHLSLCESLQPNTWIGYISTTSVYGNHDGNWVTEESKVKCQPGSKGELYYKAEKEWRIAARDCNWRLHIFRCAGLYSDTRSALHTLMKAGVRDRPAAIGTMEHPTSRIHEEDVARIILHATAIGEETDDCCIWNLSDDEPAPRSEVIMYGPKLLENIGISMPCHKHTKSQPRLSQRDKKRQSDNKRVSNQRIKATLLPGGKLLYPTYREGLKSVLDNNKEAWCE